MKSLAAYISVLSFCCAFGTLLCAQAPNFDDLGNMYGQQSEAEATYKADFIAECVFDRRAMHYKTDAMDLWLTEEGGVFNGQRFFWKKTDNFVGVFVNTHKSTKGSYNGIGAPYIAVTDKNNIISLSSATRKSLIRFYADHIVINTKIRNWLLIIPFPSLKKTDTIELDSVDSLEMNLPRIIRTLTDDNLITIDLDMVRLARIEPWKEYAEQARTGRLDFEKALERLLEKKKKIYKSNERDNLVLSFYRACADSLSFDQVKELKRAVYSMSARDFIMYSWATARDLDVDEVIKARNEIYQMELRDRLIFGYVRYNHQRLGKDDIERLRRKCYQMKYRDEIAIRYQ